MFEFEHPCQFFYGQRALVVSAQKICNSIVGYWPTNYVEVVFVSFNPLVPIQENEFRPLLVWFGKR